jgi:uncharacterized protein (TIGR00255 family)
MNSAQSPAPQPAPVRSMTGYSRVRKTAGDVDIVLSVKSVNHRALDLHFHCPSELDPIENEMRAMVRRSLTRGHVEIRVSLPRAAAVAGLDLNLPLLEAYIQAFRKASAQHGLTADPDLNSALRLPGMFGEPAEPELRTDAQQAVLEALAEGLDILNRVREREASDIVRLMLRHNDAIRRTATELAEIRSRALPLFEARLSDRLRDLLRGQNVDPQRLAQEVAMLADRSDISEEIERLRIHAGQLEVLLTGGGEIGKKLDFLLQEMNREANTVLSKTNGIGELGLRITELALAGKADIEKIREQSLNLE